MARRPSPQSVEPTWASSPAVRRNMQANRGRDTGPEMQLRRLLHTSGLRYRVHWPVPGERRRRIDIAFTRSKVAVFVDGCFWHRCPDHYSAPKVNGEFWDAKIRKNVERDAHTTSLLVETGWLVMRFWEHDEPGRVAASVRVAVHDRAASSRQVLRNSGTFGL